MQLMTPEEQHQALLSLFSQTLPVASSIKEEQRTIENPRKRPRESSVSPKLSTPSPKLATVEHPYPTPTTEDRNKAVSLGDGVSQFLASSMGDQSTSAGFGLKGFTQAHSFSQARTMQGASSYQYTPSDSENKQIQAQSASKKERKEERERLRRKRINKSTLQLRNILVEAIPNEATKLEKGDIYELTITYIRRLQKEIAQMKKAGKALESVQPPETLQQSSVAGYMAGCADASRYFAQLLFPTTAALPQIPLQFPNLNLAQFSMMNGASVGFKIEQPTSVPLYQPPIKPEPADDEISNTSSSSTDIKLEAAESDGNGTKSSHYIGRLVIDEDDNAYSSDKDE